MTLNDAMIGIKCCKRDHKMRKKCEGQAEGGLNHTFNV